MPRFRGPITIISQSSRWYPSSGPSSPYPSGSPEKSPPNRVPARRDAPLPEPTNCLKLPRQRTGSCPVAPCEASRHRSSPWLEPSVEFLLESPIAEHSLDSTFLRGKYEVHQAEPVYLVRLATSGRSPGIPEGAVCDRLTQCKARHTHRRIGDFSSIFTPLDPLCSAQQGHLS